MMNILELKNYYWELKMVRTNKQVCPRCNKKVEILISNNKIVDFLCEKCYTGETGEEVVKEPEHWKIDKED